MLSLRRARCSASGAWMLSLRRLDAQPAASTMRTIIIAMKAANIQ